MRYLPLQILMGVRLGISYLLYQEFDYGKFGVIIIIIIITCYLSTPFIILQIHKSASRVIFTNFLNAHSLTRPHPHAVRRKVIIISNCRLVPY